MGSKLFITQPLNIFKEMEAIRRTSIKPLTVAHWKRFIPEVEAIAGSRVGTYQRVVRKTKECNGVVGHVEVQDGRVITVGHVWRRITQI